MPGPAIIASAEFDWSSRPTIVIGVPDEIRRSAVWVAMLAPSIWPDTSAALIWSSVSKLVTVAVTPFLPKKSLSLAIHHGP